MNDASLATRNRIADAALRLTARRGPLRLSMTDIGVEAGVSRGTLYRYFAHLDDVLAAAERRVEQTLELALLEAVSADPRPEQRVSVVLAALEHHTATHPGLQALIAEEPARVLAYAVRRFDVLRDLLAAALDPVLRLSPSVRAGVMTEEQLAEVLLRVVLSHHVVPAGDQVASSRQLHVLASVLVLGAAATEVELRRAS